jgi:hypothetical protein
MNLGSCRACTSQVSWCAGGTWGLGRGGGAGGINRVFPKNNYFPNTYLLKKFHLKSGNSPRAPVWGISGTACRPRLGLRAQHSSAPPSITSRTLYPVPCTGGPRYQAQQPCTLNPPGPSFAVPILVIDRKGPVLPPRAAVPEPRSILLATLGTGMLLTALFRP